MGKKSNYFRHTFNAHKDHKIMELIERGGIKCVGVYFVILELYGAALIDDDDAESKQKISVRLIANATGLRSDSCRTCVELVADCELIEAVHFMSHIAYFEVDIPNFSKYYGKYSKTETIKSPKKRKEKERKEKESKEEVIATKLLVSPLDVFTLWNHICGTKLPIAKALSAQRKKTITAAIRNIKGLENREGWELYFKKILQTPFLLGDNNRSWKATFDWVINSNNAIKVSEDKYNGQNQSYSEQKQNKMLNMENPYA